MANFENRLGKPWLSWQVALAAVLFFSMSKAEGAQVVFVGSTYAVVDVGSHHGLSKGDRLCFYRDYVSLALCGEVRALRHKLSGVWVGAQAVSDLVLGMSVLGETLDETKNVTPVSKKEIRAFVRALKKAEKKAKAKKPEVKNTTESEDLSNEESSLAPIREPIQVTWSYVFSARTPWTYRIPVYNLINEVNRTGPLWSEERAVKLSPIGTEFLLIFPFADKMGFTTGAHGRWFADDTLVVNYNALNPNEGAQGVTSAWSYGVSLGLQWWHFMTPLIEGHLGTGFDLDIASVEHALSTIDGVSQDKIAQVKSELMVTSWRVDSLIRMRLGPVFFDSGVALLLPVAAIPKFKVDLTGLRTTIDEEQLSGAKDDLRRALAHQKASYGAQIFVGLGAAF